MDIDNRELVKEFYQPLYRFAFTLARTEEDGVGLVQKTFLKWAEKGQRIRDDTKARVWMFSTLYREFLNSKRRQEMSPHIGIDRFGSESGNISPDAIDGFDAAIVMGALQALDEEFRSVLAMFYLKGSSYKEIAAVLHIPIGTAMARVLRGKMQLYRALARAGPDRVNSA